MGSRKNRATSSSPYATTSGVLLAIAAVPLDERPVLAAIEMNIDAAMDGEPVQRQQIVMSVTALSEINREAMRAADTEAKRLGNAGAWAAVFVGFLSFLLSILLLLRLRRRFVRPLLELIGVLEDVHQGNRLRRCGLMDAPREVMQVRDAVNRLLDERLGRSLEAAD